LGLGLVAITLGKDTTPTHVDLLNTLPGLVEGAAVEEVNGSFVIAISYKE
jgi:hypothetical protein